MHLLHRLTKQELEKGVACAALNKDTNLGYKKKVTAPNCQKEEGCPMMTKQTF